MANVEWKVLIVDDEPDNVGVAQHVLTFFGAQVQSSNTGVNALHLLEEDRPDFLLLDIQMPRKSGFQVLEEIRAHESLHDLPVIALTSHAMPEDYERAMRAGFDGYITKPITVTTFVEEIQTILAGIERSTSQLTSQPVMKS
jgi:two-component system, cell cycle response regulator DivK